MALINCPECRREVSDKAPACVQCGYPVASRAPMPPQQVPQVMHTQTHFSHQEKGTFEKEMGGVVGKGCGIMILYAIIGVVILILVAIKNAK